MKEEADTKRTNDGEGIVEEDVTSVLKKLIQKREFYKVAPKTKNM